MDLYQWTGINQQGKSLSARRYSPTISQLKNSLRRQGIKPIQVRKVQHLAIKFFKPRSKLFNITAFTRQFATMLNAGVHLVKALDIIASGQENLQNQYIILQLREAINQGDSLGHALSLQQRYFPTLYCQLITVGEQAGKLDTILSYLADYLEKMGRLRKQMIKAVSYPASVLIIALLVTSGLLIFIVPEFKQVFQSYGAELPILTQIVIDIGDFSRHYFPVLLFSLILLLFLAHRYRERLLPRLPLIGPLLNQSMIARYCHSLALTFRAGVPLLSALSLIAKTSGNRYFEQSCEQLQQRVASGWALHIALNNSSHFPDLVSQMVAVGEESGQLDHMLSKVAEYYSECVDNTVSQLTSLLEPIIMVILALLIGGIIIAMYLPIFQMGELI